MKRVLLKTLQPAVVMMALFAASIAFSLGACAAPISTPDALRGASDQPSVLFLPLPLGGAGPLTVDAVTWARADEVIE